MPETFDVFCPNCNIQVAANVIAQGVGGMRSEAATIEDIPDAEYRNDHYSVALCSRCSAPFLIRQALYGIPAEFETVTETQILYPASTKLPLEGLPQRVRSTHEQAVRSFGVASYEACALMCRRCIEVICKSHGAAGANLAARLDAMATAGHIDSKLASWAHGIRVLGNEAAHDVNSSVAKDDARDVLDFTEALLLYIYSLSPRFVRFQARRRRPPS